MSPKLIVHLSVKVKKRNLFHDDNSKLIQNNINKSEMLKNKLNYNCKTKTNEMVNFKPV